MRLSSVDFPTFGFPATVTIPALGITEDTSSLLVNCCRKKQKDRSQ
jgi:hypothetical protein